MDHASGNLHDWCCTLQRQQIKFDMSRHSRQTVYTKYYLEVYFDAWQVFYHYLTHIQVNYLEVTLQAGTESQLTITH